MNDAAVFAHATSGWLDLAGLLKVQCTGGELRPHPTQSVCAFAPIARDVARAIRPNLVLWAFDSLGYAPFVRACGHHLRAVAPVTSTVPSTSMTAWTSILRGSPPERHGVYGTAFYVRELDRTVSLLSAPAAPGPDEELPWHLPEAGPTLLATLRGAGYATYFLGLRSALTGLSFFRQLSEHSERVEFPDDPEFEADPMAAAMHLAAQVEACLRSSRRDEPVCCIAFSDHVRHISENGYTDVLLGAVDALARRWRDLRSRLADLTVLGVADHGMVAQQPILLTPLIYDPDVLQLSRHRPGGAGRILFFYPGEGRAAQLAHLLRERIGESGTLLERAAYVERYYRPEALATDRIGEIVAVATSNAFPSASIADAFEHGALDPQEMLSYVALV